MRHARCDSVRRDSVYRFLRWKKLIPDSTSYWFNELKESKTLRYPEFMRRYYPLSLKNERTERLYQQYLKDKKDYKRLSR